jgi:hypothetical protein
MAITTLVTTPIVGTFAKAPESKQKAGRNFRLFEYLPMDSG